MERALPSAEVKPRIAAAAIGRGTDCDAPEDSVEDLMRSHLTDARTLPFVGLLTPDGEWIDGWSGHKDAAGVLAVLTKAQQSPLLAATPAVQKRLDKLAKDATTAAQKGAWKAVLVAARDAGKSIGRCEQRDTIRAAEQQARAWAAEQLATAVQEARSGGDLTPVRKRIAEVRRHFGDEPEGLDAEQGRKAVLRLTQIRDAETQPNPKKDLREKAAETFAGSRWPAIFERPAPAPAKDAPGDGG